MTAGNVLKAGNVTLGDGGRFAVVARGNSDYTSLDAAGDLVLDGQLSVDVQGTLSGGTPLTIARGRSVTGTFDGLPEGSFLYVGGRTFTITYKNNAVTLVVAATADTPVGGNGAGDAVADARCRRPSSRAFTPGVGATYEASTLANVISTAGDALLSVADPSSQNTGHLVNGTFFLPQPLQARARNATNTGTPYNNVG